MKWDVFFPCDMGDPSSGWGNQYIYRKDGFLLCLRGDGDIFFSLLKLKKKKFYSISASENGPHAAISSNSDPLGNDGHETNLRKHEINIKIETLKVLASCRF